MRIQHNIMAMNAYRNYNNNTSALSKNLEKLSSGYKINRAGDDAAGLAISEKMRAQVTGLEVAQKNAKDGISLVQTAEGALTEVHDMLNRMYELANQSANGTYEDTTDRNQLQKEVVQLRDEIDRIADAANFNGIKLLDGTMDAEGVTGGGATPVTFSSVSAETEKVSMALPSFTVNLEGLAVKAGSGSAAVDAKIKVGSKTFTVSGSASASGAIADFTKFTKVNGGSSVATATVGGLKYTVGIAAGVLTFTAKTSQTNTDLTASGVVLNPAFEVAAQAGTNGSLVGSLINGGTQIIQSGQVEKNAAPAKASFALSLNMLKENAKIKIGDQTFTIDYTKKGTEATGTVIGVKDLLDKTTGKLDENDISEIASRITKAEGGNNGVFVVGNNGDKITLTGKAAAPTSVDLTDVDKIKGQVSVTVPEIHGTALTLQIGDSNESYNQLQVSIKNCHAESLGIGSIDIGKQTGAKAAAGSIKKAIDYISDVRGTLGATQNRLDHTINNLSVMQENIQDAEATIRDTDVADEMMAYTKNNILIQSAQAMLAQANQVPQGVLQLLQ